MELSMRVCKIKNATLIPTFFLKGVRSETVATFGRLRVLSAPLRGSPNKLPALPEFI
jgi:hypothetical protein